MPRHVQVLEGVFGVIEDMGYAVGDAEDFVLRERDHMHDLLDGVADGKLSVSGAKREVDVAFANAARQIDEARQLLASGARRSGFTHIHPSLLEAMNEPSVAPIRLIAVLPTGEESA